MSHYRDRTGQCIGPWLVVADHKRTKQGRVVWKLVHQEDGRAKYLRTNQVIALDRELSVSPEAAG